MPGNQFHCTRLYCLLQKSQNQNVQTRKFVLKEKTRNLAQACSCLYSFRFHMHHLVQVTFALAVFWLPPACDSLARRSFRSGRTDDRELAVLSSFLVSCLARAWLGFCCLLANETKIKKPPYNCLVIFQSLQCCVSKLTTTNFLTMKLKLKVMSFALLLLLTSFWEFCGLAPLPFPLYVRDQCTQKEDSYLPTTERGFESFNLEFWTSQLGVTVGHGQPRQAHHLCLSNSNIKLSILGFSELVFLSRSPNSTTCSCMKPCAKRPRIWSLN